MENTRDASRIAPAVLNVQESWEPLNMICSMGENNPRF